MGVDGVDGLGGGNSRGGNSRGGWLRGLKYS